jgi:hypothetical protein
MPRQAIKGLEGYSAYLESVGISINTAKTYKSHVRRIRDTVTDLSEATLTAFLYSSVTSVTRSTMRAAWRHYRAFVYEETSEYIPNFGNIAPGVLHELEASFNPTPAVQVALAAIINTSKVSVTMLAAATWRCISLSKVNNQPHVYLKVREGTVSGALFPHQLLVPLLAWAAPDTNTPAKTQPLIPTTAGGLKSVTALQLRRLAARAMEIHPHSSEKIEAVEEYTNVFNLQEELAAFEKASKSLVLPDTPKPATTAPAVVELKQESAYAIPLVSNDAPMTTDQLMDFLKA